MTRPSISDVGQGISRYVRKRKRIFFTVTKLLSLQAVERIVRINLVFVMDHSGTPGKEDIQKIAWFFVVPFC